MSNPEAAVREYPSVLAVAQGYGLGVTKYAAVPGGFLLETASGQYWLKPFAGSDKELAFVVAASEHLVRRGFPFLTRCLRLSDGSPGIRFRRVLFYLVEASPGPAPKLESLEDLKTAGTRLGWFHLAARSFVPPTGLDDIRSEWGSCERVFKERLLDLYDFQETCADRPRRTRFDVLYLERFNDFVDAAREAMDIVADLPLPRMIAIARSEQQFCHGDFSPAALAVDEQGEYVVTDLEMARFDLRASDIAELIRATHEYDISRAAAVLEGYHAAFPLAQEDVRLVEAYLRFPRDYWRAANAYYREGINARARLSEAIANHETGRRFLDSFRRLSEDFPASGIYVEKQPDSTFEAGDGFFPPAAFAEAIGTADDAGVGPVDAAQSAEQDEQPLYGAAEELGDLPYPTAPDVMAPIADNQPGDGEPPRPGRRRTLSERCLFDERLPRRRRGVSVAPAIDTPLDIPAEPSGEVPPPDDVRAPEEPELPQWMPPAQVDLPPETSPSVPDSIVGGPLAEPLVEPQLPVAEPVPQATGAPTAPASAVAPPESGERKKIVWKFPAPLARQEDKG